MIFQCRGINHYIVSSITDRIIYTIKLSKLTKYFFSSLLDFTKEHSCADFLDILITKPRAQCVLFPLTSQSFQQFITGIVVFFLSRLARNNRKAQSLYLDEILFFMAFNLASIRSNRVAQCSRTIS